VAAACFGQAVNTDSVCTAQHCTALHSTHRSVVQCAQHSTARTVSCAVCTAQHASFSCAQHNTAQHAVVHSTAQHAPFSCAVCTAQHAPFSCAVCTAQHYTARTVQLSRCRIKKNEKSNLRINKWNLKCRIGRIVVGGILYDLAQDFDCVTYILILKLNFDRITGKANECVTASLLPGVWQWWGIRRHKAEGIFPLCVGEEGITHWSWIAWNLEIGERNF